VLNGDLTDVGVKVPIEAHVYNPILAELTEYGVTFVEKEHVLAASNH
jgi:hypothetical protein